MVHTCNECNKEYKTEKTLATHIAKIHQEKSQETSQEKKSEEDNKSFQTINLEKLIKDYTFLKCSIHILEEQIDTTKYIITAIKKKVFENE